MWLFFTAAFHAFTFTYNGYYLGLGGSTPGLRHFIPLWSLAVEEVFYLAWPILLKGLKSARLILVFLGVLIIFGPAYRIEHGYISLYQYLGCIDMLALGSVVAFLRKSTKFSKIANHASLLLPVTFLLIFFVLCGVDIQNHFVIAPSLVGGLTGFYLLLSNNFDQRTARARYFKYIVSPLSLLGMLSYEVYLFHLMFMNIFYRLDFNNGTNYLSGPVPLVSLVLFSYFLHRFLFEPTRIKLTKFLK
jgi:peptidoglycan/LPS O-acetylase OafA/YrhL